MREAVQIEDVAAAGIRVVTVRCEACARHGVYAVARLQQSCPQLRMTAFLAELDDLLRSAARAGDLCPMPGCV